jgi:hypothetical protein
VSNQDSYAVTETEQLLRHALATSKRMTNLSLALELDVKPPRISEGLRGAWNLKPEHKQRLIEKFGQPRGAAGRYIRAEQFDSFSAFLDQASEIYRKHHLASVLETFRDQSFQEKLAETVYRRPSDTAFPYPALTAAQVTKTLVAFEQFLLSPEFSRWLQAVRIGHKKLMQEDLGVREMQSYFWAAKYYNVELIEQIPIPARDCDLPRDAGLEALAGESGLDFVQMNALDLAAIGAAFLAVQDERHHWAAKLKKPLSLLPQNLNVDLMDRNEFVVTGDLVWEEEGEFAKPKIGQPFAEESIFRKSNGNSQEVVEPRFEQPTLLGTSQYRKKTSWDLDYWTTYRIELFLRNDCNYCLLIEVGNDHAASIPRGHHHPQWTFVIPKIIGRHVFDHLYEVRAWLGLDELPEHLIKTRIAEKGGYIPGAEII